MIRSDDLAVPARLVRRRAQPGPSLFGRLAAGLAMLALVATGFALPAQGQSVPVTVTLTPEVPAGFTIANLPVFTNQRVLIQVTNVSSTPVLNQQIVLRMGARPDSILSVSDGAALVGVLDAATGAWFHTISSIAPGATTTFTALWFKVCPGRWPLAVRVGDKTASITAQWVGQSDPRCTPDETVSPQSASFYQLPWPPSASAVGATTSSSIVFTTSLPGATTTTLPGATTTALITPPGVTSTTVAGATTTSTTRLNSTSTTLLSLTLATTTTAVQRTTTIPRSTTTLPGTVILCKTVGGKRYCAPKSSAYKTGQKKSVEVKPKTTAKKKQ